MRELLGNRRFQDIFYVYGATLVVLLGALLLGYKISGILLIVNKIGVVIALIVALWARFGTNQAEASPQIWGEIVTGLVFWTIAEGIWALYSWQGWGKGPGTIAADVLWLLGYIPFMQALATRYQNHLNRLGSNGALNPILFILALFIPITYILLFPLVPFRVYW